MTTVVWPHRINPLLGMKTDASTSPAKASAKALRIVMAGGGTGGHLYPGLAIAAALEARTGSAGQPLEILWAATPRSVDQRLLTRFGDHYIKQPVQPMTRSFKKLWPMFQGWRHSCGYWRKQFAQHKTDAVVALGGYAAAPAAYIAGKRGIPVILLNPDALPGLANRFLLKRSDLVITQWPLAEAFTKNLKAQVKPLGCPIRVELTQTPRTQAAAALNLDPARRTLVITGASLGAKTINDAFLALLADQTIRAAFRREQTGAAAGWQVLHLAGIEQAEAVRAAYDKYPEVSVRVLGYCDDMASVWGIADLAIARAGASTCAELTACGVPSILLPYPFHKDMHQKANALALMSAGAAVIVDDTRQPELNALAIKRVLQTLLYEDEIREEMRSAARAAGKPEAAAQIAQEILSRIDPSSR